MRDVSRRAPLAAALTLLLLSGCGREEPRAAVEDRRDVPAAAARSGTARDFGIAVTNVLQRNVPAGVDSRFEVRNSGRSIVKFEAVDGDPGPEVALSVEIFRRGAWERVATSGTRSTRFEDLWPGATLYARAVVPHEVRFARVVARARGLVDAKSGATRTEVTEISSDAFEIPPPK